MKYTRKYVRAMSADEYREAMCNELNAAGFREHFHDQESEYEADEFVFGGSIESDKEAVDYLKSIGLIDNGKCPFCGEREEGQHQLQSPRSGAVFHVCDKCYKQRSVQERQKRGCGCCLGIAILIAFIIYLIIK